MMGETAMGGGRKRLVVGLREREKGEGELKKKVLFLAFVLGKML